MAELQRLHFSIGPVQGFVAQSRRTRDLWASSFLLSHLAQVALDTVRQHDLPALFAELDALADLSTSTIDAADRIAA